MAIAPTERRGDERGFSLILIVVMIGVLALTLAIIPEDVFIQATYREKTELEMEWVAQLLHDYYADVRSFPASLAELEVKPEAANQWLGPYAIDRSDADHEAANDHTADAWGRAFTFVVTGLGKGTLSSVGRDGVASTSDDIVVMIDCADVLRDETLVEIDIIEAAILAWNVDCLPASPLPADYPVLLDTLQTWGYLPQGADVTAELLVDAWGAQYVTGPSPVFDIDSTSW